MKEKCYVCVDKDGTEKITNNEPIRRQFKGKRLISVLWGYCKGNYSKNNWNKWCEGWSTDENDFLPFSGVILPKGTILKLTEKTLTWEDEPIEINSDKNYIKYYKHN
jgi:hypothetical protein